MVIAVVVSCSASSVDSTSKTQPDSTVTHNTIVAIQSDEPTATAQIKELGTDGLATYDENIPDGDYNAFYIYHQDLDSLARASDIVFAGRITEYIESALAVPRTDTTNVGLQIDVYDGIVFAVDEVLSGELSSDTKKVMVLTSH